MKRISSDPVILPLTTVKSTRDESQIVPFHRRGRSLRRGTARRRADRGPRDEHRDEALGEMRGRLLKMIIANEWDRTNGHRAS